MMHRNVACFLVLIFATSLCYGQFRNGLTGVDGFFFPGEADRDNVKFPLNQQQQQQQPQPFPTNPPITNTQPPAAMTYTQCLNNCQSTSEYNPICGTDNMVYSNPGRLNCARSCGSSVEVKNFGPCDTGNVRG